ncbi:MAG: hypothetical protein C4518_18820 [Desulfobacteraceae bacterium]|nr:MAG: hypothetical protein C4518_18820 [Desulfobacteraceae bacterium]
MSKNKKILVSLIGIAGVMVLIIARMYLLPGETPENKILPLVSEEQNPEKEQLESALPADNREPAELSPKAGPDTAAPSKLDELKQADDLDMNLVDGSLREYITSLYFKYRNSKDRDEFMAQIKTELFSQFPPETADKLLKIYESYIDCELGIQEMLVGFDPPENDEDMIFMENEIFEFRKAQMGEELAKKLFGQEHKLTLFKIKSAKIFKDDTLYGREKERQLQQVAVDVYGDVPDGYLSDKTGESLYQEKLLIYKKDLDEMNEDARKEKIREFRSEYLPAEDIEKIETAEAQVEAVAKRDQDYTENKNAILNDADLDDAEKQDKIHALQDEVYGDRADEIRRGEAFSEEQNDNMEKALKEAGAGEPPANPVTETE